MSERFGDELRIRIETTSMNVAALAGSAPFSAGRVAVRGGTLGQQAESATVLVRGTHVVDSEIRVRASECLQLDAPLDPASALMVLPLASALASWETLRLELGDAAIWTDGQPLSGLVGQVAIWRGACPGVALGTSAGGDQDPEGVERIDAGDQDAAVAKLSEIVARRPGFAAVDLSGRADMIDILLEVVPRWGRLLLAGPQGAPVTIDFYKNVHRKGIVLAATVLDPAGLIGSKPGRGAADQIAKAAAILGNARMADRCRHLLGASEAPHAVSLAG
jgi:hypothetical protein